MSTVTAKEKDVSVSGGREVSITGPRGGDVPLVT